VLAAAVQAAVPAVEQAVLAVEALTAEWAAPAALTLPNPPGAKAVQLAILLLNRPAVRAKTVLIPQGRELGLVPRRGAAADMSEPVPRYRSLRARGWRQVPLVNKRSS